MEYIYIGAALENIHRLAKCNSRIAFINNLKEEGVVDTTYSTFKDWEKHGTIKLQALIGICNYVKLPIVYFLGIKGFRRNFHHYQTVNDNWEPIVWDTTKFIEDCMEKCHYRQKEVRSLTGMSNKMFAFLKEGNKEALQHMSIDKFLGYVNSADLHIANYIIDKNVPYGEEEEQYFRFYYSRLNENNENPNVAEDTNNLEMENKALRERLHQLEDEIIKLRQENLQLQKVIQDLIK